MFLQSAYWKLVYSILCSEVVQIRYARKIGNILHNTITSCPYFLKIHRKSLFIHAAVIRYSHKLQYQFLASVSERCFTLAPSSLPYRCDDLAANSTSPFLPSSSQNTVQDQKALCSDRSFLAESWHCEPFLQLPVVAQLELEISAGLSQEDNPVPHTYSPLLLSNSLLRHHLLSIFHTWKQEDINSVPRSPYLWLPALLRDAMGQNMERGWEKEGSRASR